MEARVIELLPLAAKIAREFGNIPGLPQSDIEMAAQEVLARAARAFDPAKGDFAAYAATAMRNALRDLHSRQARHHRHHIYNLDVTATSSATARGRRVDLIPARHVPVTDEAAAQESLLRLNQAMGTLSPRLRQIAEGIAITQMRTLLSASSVKRLKQTSPDHTPPAPIRGRMPENWTKRKRVKIPLKLANRTRISRLSVKPNESMASSRSLAHRFHTVSVSSF